MGKKRRMTRENAKKIVSKTGATARKAGVGAKKIGSGAKRIASAPGRKMKQKMDNYNERMLAIEWTSKKMLKDYLKFNFVGGFNQLFALTMYATFYWANVWPEHRAVTAWVLSMLISQIEAHYAHYRFTFGSATDYWKSFKRTMIIYTTILCFSTISEYILVERMLINHLYAWPINAVLFGYVNFAFLRWLAFPPEHDKSLSYLIEEE